MTLNSSSLPSKCEVSLTGRRSTSEPGRKARMPFTMTVRPPFTLPETTPLMIVPLSSASSRLVPGGELLRLVARELGRAEAVFERFDGDGDEIAGLDLDLAAVVLEFFGGDRALGLESGVHDHDVRVDAR